MRKLSELINAHEPYILPTASSEVLGGIKVGNLLNINEGVLSAEVNLPVASAETLGGVKIGAGLNIEDGVLSANPAGVEMPSYSGSEIEGEWWV